MNIMQKIPKSGILKVSTLSESLTSTSSSTSSLSRRGRISPAHQSKLRRNPQKQDGPHERRTSSNSTLDSQSSDDMTAATTNLHDEAETQTNDVKQTKVRFNTISIREYEIQPSDNPSSILFPGLELGWKYNIVLPSGSIDAFENLRAIQRKPHYQRRPLPIQHRRILLLHFGFSNAEIEAASERARALREERERSVERMNLDWYDRIVEDLRVGCNRALKWRSCKGSAVVDGVEGSKRENGSLFHPSVSVDTSVDTSSFFETSSSKGDNQQHMLLDDDDDFATKGEDAPKG